ncbi:MAG: hypothetical protein WBP59_13850 [Ilumatobacteraceae bacterium]
MINPADSNSSTRLGRRDALKLGGLTVSLAAIAAACGDDRTGDDAPGRVGYQPPITDPGDYAVDSAVLLRTISSVENTVAYAYGKLLEAGDLEADVSVLVERFIEDHEKIALEMGALTVAAGGEAWECTNPWMMERLIEPVLAAIDVSDEPEIDAVNTVIALENLSAATNQEITIELDDPDAASATLAAAILESRQSAAVVAQSRGADGYVNPAINGGEAPSDNQGRPLTYSVVTRFGSVGQIDLVVGPPDENGVRESFALQTPSLNSYIYNETAPTC